MKVLFHPPPKTVLSHRFESRCSRGKERGEESTGRQPGEVPGSLYYSNLERGSKTRTLEFWEASQIRQLVSHYQCGKGSSMRMAGLVAPTVSDSWASYLLVLILVGAKNFLLTLSVSVSILHSISTINMV